MNKNQKRRNYILVIFSMFVCLSAQAQNDKATTKTDSLYKASQLQTQTTSQKHADTRPLSQRIGFDITTSFWINPSSSFFEFSPVVVYKFPRIISIGTGPS